MNRKKYPVRVYVGCSLTQASPKFRAEIADFQAKLNKVCEVLKFKGLSDKNKPYDVYIYDVHNCVGKCDLMVAICDFPSIGLGYELATQAEKRKKPVLVVAHKDALVSKLILDPQLPGFDVRRYENFEDVIGMVIEKIEKMKKHRFSFFLIRCKNFKFSNMKFFAPFFKKSQLATS